MSGSVPRTVSDGHIRVAIRAATGTTAASSQDTTLSAGDTLGGMEEKKINRGNGTLCRENTESLLLPLFSLIGRNYILFFDSPHFALLFLLAMIPNHLSMERTLSGRDFLKCWMNSSSIDSGKGNSQGSCFVLARPPNFFGFKPSSLAIWMWAWES